MTNSRAPGPSFSLADILTRLKSSRPGRTLLVFDLDSTLYDLALRVTAILDRYANDPCNRERFPDECQKLETVEIRKGDWGLSEPLGRLGIGPKTHKAFFDHVQSAWARGFFSNQFLKHDVPLPGAVEFVKQVVHLGADVIYLTGRDEPRMGSGTRESLVDHGFPFANEELGDRVKLVLKPQSDLDDAEFKADLIAGWCLNYEDVWLFENEPVNINAVARRAPKVKMVFIDTCHSGLESVSNAIATIPHFEISISEIE